MRRAAFFIPAPQIVFTAFEFLQRYTPCLDGVS